MMTREERARQFMPFDAMKGLRDALKEREEQHERVRRHDIPEMQKAANSGELSRIEKGMTVEIHCYRHFHDISFEGKVDDIDMSMKYIVVDEEKILFEDIYSIRITN